MCDVRKEAVERATVEWFNVEVRRLKKELSEAERELEKLRRLVEEAREQKRAITIPWRKIRAPF